MTYDLHHVPLIAKQALDNATPPKNVKSDFKTAGIFPFNLNVFFKSDYVAAERSGENLFGDEDDDPEDQCRIVVLTDHDMVISTAVHEEVTTSEPSTMPSTSGSMLSLATSTSSLRGALKSVGPLKIGTPAKKSNRSRKAIKSTILTSPENVSVKREKHDAKLKKLDNQKKRADSIKKTPAGEKKTPANERTTSV